MMPPPQGVKRKQHATALLYIGPVRYSAPVSHIQEIQTLLDKMATWGLVNGFASMRTEDRIVFAKAYHFSNIGPLRFVRPAGGRFGKNPPYEFPAGKFVRNPDYLPYPEHHVFPRRDINRIYDVFHTFPIECALTLKHIIEIRKTRIQIRVLFPNSTRIEVLGPNDEKVVGRRWADHVFDGYSMTMGDFAVMAPDDWNPDDLEPPNDQDVNSWHLNKPALLIDPGEAEDWEDDHIEFMLQHRITWIANDKMLNHLMMVSDPTCVQNLARAA
jgi:hypothetical protein